MLKIQLSALTFELFKAKNILDSKYGCTNVILETYPIMYIFSRNIFLCIISYNVTDSLDQDREVILFRLFYVQD